MEFWNKLCKKWFFFFQNNSVKNSLICPKDKSVNHCPTELFPIYPNNHWTIKQRDNHIVVPSSNIYRIKLKIDWFLTDSHRKSYVSVFKCKWANGLWNTEASAVSNNGSILKKKTVSPYSCDLLHYRFCLKVSLSKFRQLL